MRAVPAHVIVAAGILIQGRKKMRLAIGMVSETWGVLGDMFCLPCRLLDTDVKLPHMGHIDNAHRARCALGGHHAEYAKEILFDFLPHLVGV
jgi:hypothetical protein